MGRLIKYMGIADVAQLGKGEDCGGQLANGLTVDLEWNEGNKWVVEMPDGVPDVFIDTLLDHEGERFKEVTDMERIPLNAHQTTFKAMKQSIPATALKAQPKRDEVTSHQAPEGPSEATDTAATTITAGGSTRRAPRS